MTPEGEQPKVAVAVARAGLEQQQWMRRRPWFGRGDADECVGGAGGGGGGRDSGAIREGEGNLHPRSDRAEIERAALVYRLREPEIEDQDPGGALTAPPPQRYEPHYLFSGTMEVGESRKRVPFTTSLLAWAP